MKKPFDFWIFTITIVLLAIGTIMIFSASPPSAYIYNDGDAFYFIKKQLLMVPLSLIAMFVAMKFDYRKLGKMSPVIFGISIVLLIAVLIPGIGMSLNGARRWLIIGFQPSEIVKITLIIFLSHLIAVKGDKIRELFSGVGSCLLYTGIVVVLLALEPHYSAAIIIIMIAFILMFCGGVNLLHIGAMGAVGGSMLGFAMLVSSHSRLRITTFISSLFDESQLGWQVGNSLIAIGSGGLFGKGLNNSTEKFLYIPEPHNDFILSILAEELGFICVALVFVLFAILIFRGYRVAIGVKDKQGSLMAIGITSMIAIQFIFNVGVVSGILPATGIPLPFFSYGGTSLILLMGAMGILLNISKNSDYARVKK